MKNLAMQISKSTFSKWSFLFGLLVFAIAVLPARNAAAAAQGFPFTEQFAYGSDGNLGAAGEGDAVWTLGQNIAGQLYVGSAYSLSYSGLYPSSGRGLQMKPNTTKVNRGIDFSYSGVGASGIPWGIGTYGVNSNLDRVYASFLFTNVVTPTINNRQICFLRSNTGGGVGLAVVWLSTDGKLMISKNTTAVGKQASQASALTTGVHFIVIRYHHQAVSGNDTADMWIDPSDDDFRETRHGFRWTGRHTADARCQHKQRCRRRNHFSDFLCVCPGHQRYGPWVRTIHPCCGAVDG